MKGFGSYGQKIHTTGKKANCIGYSSLFNSIVEHLIKEQNAENDYRARHLIGRLEFVGFDLHQLFKDPFFQDHDYNEIENIHTKERIYVDPSLSDYFRINRVSSTKINF